MAKKNKNSIDLPDVKDIPGQEHVRPPRLGELSDNTASSSDEEGDDVLEPGKQDDLGIVMGNDADVTPAEKAMLANLDQRQADSEDLVLREAALDNRDEDGTPLNEKGFGRDLSGEDLDVPGADADDDDEAIGEEDEENNEYSIDDNEDDDEVDREN